MGKSVPSPARLQEFSRVITSNRLRPPTPQAPKAPRPTSSSPKPANLSGARLDTKDQQQKQKQLPHLTVENKRMEANNNSNSNSTSSAAEQGRQIPLAEVVSDCVKRWFQDTLKEAKAGDTAMQVLVSQMYYSGYGIPRDAQKVFSFSFLHPFFLSPLNFSLPLRIFMSITLIFILI